MSTFRKSAALTGALAAGVLAVSVATTGIASATVVSGGNYPSPGACSQAGKNITQNPSNPYYGWKWTCTKIVDKPLWHLALKG
ncbi:hypothetical protein ACIA49_08925 [Kribbella sp. NPDC051587]|uniref:hypothetical protein n=1 Tax=Kribbella sp. NPDC051587 TaxID=3364119 RepID=UPI003796294C